GLITIGMLWQGATGAEAQTCQPDGEVQFLCGPVSPEDLAPVPQSPWVIVSSMVDEGHLYLADIRDHRSTVIFPTDTSRPRHDITRYGACPGPVSRQFRPHGLNLHPGDSGRHTLYVVGHGEREAIEVFEVDMDGAAPTLTWVGCAVAPEELGLNSVVALPEGGFAATSPQTGDVWEWSSDSGWSRVPGSEDIGPNGLEISRDGQWFYVGGYGDQALIRLSRGRTPIQKEAVAVGFHIDNVRWGPGETLFAAGHLGPTRAAIGECIRQRQCDGVTSRVAQIDLATFTAEEIVRYPSNNLLILGTVAIQVGDEIWVGGVADGDRIARFPAP
ncbi:MAG: hypothetical protein QGG89_03310, partial [Vicinamibacterales bacterium]|nr:hypothetical protein [Vicinamibacterales bacterium]